MKVASFRTYDLVKAGTGDRLSVALYIAGYSCQNRAYLFKTETDESYLRSTLVFDSLSLISIEHKAAAELQLDAVIYKFAETKARKTFLKLTSHDHGSLFL